MKELVFISCQPDDLNWAWQVEVQIQNFRKFGYSDKMQVLVYQPLERFYIGWNPVWKEFEQRYPEVKFFYYEDRGITNIVNYLYQSIIRPHCLARHFKKFPELKDKAIFYHDADIVFTQKLNFDQFLCDDICYGSQTESYIGSAYFDRKIKDVRPEIKERYIEDKILDQAAKIVGINEHELREKETKAGGDIGAQYLLKNIDSKFWSKVEMDCIKLMLFFKQTNEKYYFREDWDLKKNENIGIQRWCADMWAVLWNLWERGLEVKVDSEFDFAWATSKIEVWDQVKIFHNAGVVGEAPIENPDGTKSLLFFKGRESYVNNINTPMFDEEMPYLRTISPTHCSYNYVREILNTKAMRDRVPIVNGKFVFNSPSTHFNVPISNNKKQ